MVKLRLKFSKNGPIKFIGHLDVMRYFQKAIRRADIDIKYSEGFSPHQLLSFAQPLSVGATSDGEYLDMTLNSMTSKEDVVEKLNAVMNEGIKILAAEELSETSAKAMTDVYAARYRIRIRESAWENVVSDNDAISSTWPDEFIKFISQDHLPAMKKTKSGEKEIDMKPMIYESKITPDIPGVEILLAMSSSATLKPALLFGKFFESLGIDFSPSYLDIHRLDMYKQIEKDGELIIEPFIKTSN